MDSNDLNKCDIQYQVRFESSLDFVVGEKVFLKSNPELPLTVTHVGILFNSVEVMWMSNKSINITKFPPQCLLPYRFAGLIIIKEKHYICSN